jgi:hypothetical protein
VSSWEKAGCRAVVLGKAFDRGRGCAIVHVQLAPGEALAPGTRAAAEALLARPEVAAVLLPLRPAGDWPLARAARRYLAAWDARFLHPMNFFAPAARAATREALPGPRNADAAPFLADALDRGLRIEALPAAPVASSMAADLAAWVAWARAEGEAWGRLAARDARFAGFLPPRWATHNLRQMPRRVIEEIQAVRSAAPLPLLLHLSRESAFAQGAAAGRTAVSHAF